jgi:GT2 family glycosyltransferase
VTADAPIGGRDPATPGAPCVPIAVVLATRNRASGALRAARSILVCDHPSFTLCIVDQSDDAATRSALAELAADPRVEVIATAPRGLSAARNLGVARSRAPLIAFTDDDCTAEPGWLAALAAAFARDPDVGLVFGQVVAAPYDRGSGFITAYGVARPQTVRSLGRKSRVEGIGACMAVRRTAWDALGGFDESLGVGTALCAGEDTDFAVRVLIAGGSVHETPAARVVHHGFRSWDEGRATIAGYMIGLGAVHVKMLRLARLRAAQPMSALAWRWLTRGPVVDLNHRPPRLRRLSAFLRGAWRGWRLPLDRRSGHFRAPSARAEEAQPIDRNPRAPGSGPASGPSR